MVISELNINLYYDSNVVTALLEFTALREVEK